MNCWRSLDAVPTKGTGKLVASPLRPWLQTRPRPWRARKQKLMYFWNHVKETAWWGGLVTLECSG